MACDCATSTGSTDHVGAVPAHRFRPPCVEHDPFLALGGLVAVRGMRYRAWITAITIVIGGGATWLLGGSGLHVGASGVVFGYFGAILGARCSSGGFDARRCAHRARVLLEPDRRGEPAAADLLEATCSAWSVCSRRSGWLSLGCRSEEPYTPEPWELDEPWNIA